jgi:hypothetical protein
MIDSRKQEEDNDTEKKDLAESMKAIPTPEGEKSGRLSSSSVREQNGGMAL